MTLYRYFLVAIISVFFAIGCTSTKQEINNVEDFSRAFYTSLAAGESKKLVNMLQENADNSQFVVSDKFEPLVQEASKKFQAEGGLDKVEVAKVDLSEDKKSADVDVVIHYGNGKTEQTKLALVKTKSGWKVL